MSRAEAVILRIVRRKFHVPLRAGDPREAAKDAEDVAGQARLKLLGRIRRAESPDLIRDIERYAAMAAQTAHVDFLRAKYRHWFGLRESLKYFLEETKDFVVWENAEFQEVAGYVGWNGRQEASREKIDHLRENPAMVLAHEPGIIGRTGKGIGPRDYRLLLEAVFNQTEGGVPLDDLVAILAPLMGAVDFRGDPESVSVQSKRERPAPDRSPEYQAIAREGWLRLWREIVSLRKPARVVYLLHFSPGEFEGFQVFEIIASPREIGRVLELTHEQYEKLWPEITLKEEDRPSLEMVRRVAVRGEIKFLLVWRYMPLPDSAIAKTLDSTPNAVRKLRSVTRHSLKTKCSAFYGWWNAE